MKRKGEGGIKRDREGGRQKRKRNKNVMIGEGGIKSERDSMDGVRKYRERRI